MPIVDTFEHGNGTTCILQNRKDDKYEVSGNIILFK